MPTLATEATQDCIVVKNAEGRHSLWPAPKAVPQGWTMVHGAATRTRCLEYVRQVGAAVSNVRSEANVGISAWADAAPVSPSRMGLGLMFFGDQENALGDDKYRLVMECAKFADQEGLAGIWLPERHFTRFGCLFPSPAVLHAAIARETKNIRLRAGSVVMPLHHPVRVAEEWSTVDNLSDGRVDLAFASGWHADDFALWPDRYEQRKDEMFQGIEHVRKLWRGERIQLPNGVGETIDVRIYPSPVQVELPVWLTAASSRATFQRAGQMGVNVLTHLFDQQIDGLAERIAAYRKARQDNGWNPDEGKVAVALHCFIASSIEKVRQHAQSPYCEYLKSNLSLLKSLALSRGVEADLSTLDSSQLDELLGFMFEKFLGNRSLLGTPETCHRLLGELSQIGVTEVACIIDFGVSTECIIDNLPNLATLSRELRSEVA